MISIVILKVAPICLYQSTEKSLKSPLNIPKALKSPNLRLKETKRMTTEMLKNCKIVILTNVDTVASFFVNFFSKEDIMSNIVQATTLMTAMMIGAPCLIAVSVA